ncbi:hypothetical protein Bbelb_291650 [Branchiostoma belcheri]|nr:hypothetical protein Bbelb_291650 [Branchiostoma belcheri]
MDTALYNNLFKEVSKREEVSFMDYSEAFPTSQQVQAFLDGTTWVGDFLQDVYYIQRRVPAKLFGHWAGKCPLNVRNAKKDKPKHQGRVKPSPQTHPCSVCHELEKVVRSAANIQQLRQNRPKGARVKNEIINKLETDLRILSLKRSVVCGKHSKKVHPEAQLQTQNMNMMGDDPEDQAEAAWSQENAWLGRLEQIWSDPGVDHYSRVSAWSSWVRLLVEFKRPEEWLYSAAQGA